jgi:glycosyltransferase involved in cell wall biosynthesis
MAACVNPLKTESARWGRPTGFTVPDGNRIRSRICPWRMFTCIRLASARFEGLPFALLEAMAHQLPCVISPSLASELEEFPHDTWVIAGEDPSSWLDLVMDSSGMERIGKRSRERIIESFSIQAMARSYMKLYESLMDSWKGQPS